MCPWCREWSPIETYTTLLLPPDYTRQCVLIYKHGGDGCKRLFSLDPSR